ncbi:MAG: helix-turn-helix domain-containing protein [Ktedonobacteraceae bacterium]|nr:helix-turn-helix domain-containing protein [Ktedonobacteraceae bacterium]
MMEKLLLTKTQTKLLLDGVHASTSPQRLVERAGILLDAAQSGNKLKVATKYSVGRDTVRRWCQRWQSYQAELDRLETEHQAGTLSDTMYRREIETILADAPRPGAPATFTEEQKQQILAVATRKPEDEGVPITHWSHGLLAQTVVDKGIVKAISPAQIGRFLKECGITTTSKSVLGTPQH